MINDFFLIFYWWFLLFGLGIIFLPLTKLFFKNFFDFGYAFSKIIAILLVSYLVWLAGSLKIFSFSTPTIWLVISVLTLANLLLAKKYKTEFLKQIRAGWRILVFEEILFFFLLTVWSFIRGFQPNIEGLEKFMDFGFVNSILRSQYFPPSDMWMAGKTINYYYFGHLVAAILTKISGFDSAVTYNLMIATIFALTFTATFSLGSNLYLQATSLLYRNKVTRWKPILLAGLISASLLTLGGNLHPLYWFLTHGNFSSYWYPDATRFIVEKFGALDNTIHEFPIYSFVVSDLHGHVSNIPFVLLFLALLFSFLISKRFSIFNFQFSIPLALVLAVMYMTNSWDFPIYFLVFGATIFYVYYSQYGFSLKSILNIGLSVVLVLIGSIFFSLPFHLHFSQIAQGIGFVHARSPFWQLLVLWGYQWMIMVSFLVFLVLQKIQNTKYKIQNTDAFVLILLAIATLLIIVPEIFYVKDIYIASYHRANTMFKLVYQSFMIYALISGYVIVRLISNIKKQKAKILNFYSVFLIFTFLFLIFVMIYPYFAVKSYYGLVSYQGLEGLGFLKQSEPDDFAGILWLKQNIIGQPVVLEAVGDSYTDYNRVSAITGLPTVEGWLVHEWLWRGSFEEPGQRNTEVTTIYESPDQNLVKALLKKYKVQYIFIGTKEWEKYQISEEKFKTLGSLVFQQENTKIYSLLRLDN